MGGLFDVQVRRKGEASLFLSLRMWPSSYLFNRKVGKYLTIRAHFI